MSSTRIHLLFGTATLGSEGKDGVRIHDLRECQETIDTLYRHGHTELDTARLYADGTTEQYLAQLDLRDCTVDTKVFPLTPGDHRPANLRAIFQTSLKHLASRKVRVLYLHAPDRSVPFEETLSEINAMHKERLFEIFGLSNFASWEVAEIVGICKAKGWIQPTIYQAMYNAITRSMESELLPCVRKLGLRLVVYNPLAGGFFAGKISSTTAVPPEGGRFDAKAGQSRLGSLYRDRYLRTSYFDALQLIKDVAEKHNLRLTEIALRWLQHHSALTPEDGVILGASSAAQLEQNCTDSEKSPLPEDVVAAVDEAAKIVGADAPPYWR